MRRIWRRGLGLGSVAFAGAMTLAWASTLAAEPGPLERDKQSLAPLQALVGEWRGVGQPKRGSNQGAWTETSQWSWRFNDNHAELVATLDPPKFYSQLQIQPGEEPGQFVLLATPGDASKSATATAANEQPPRRFVGRWSDDALVVTAVTPAENQPDRISLRLVARGDRLLALFERSSGGDSFSRMAEVGSTRKGSSFAKTAASGPECVVTGGLGTIAVEHQGKKYFVCCGGCRDLFQDDPDGVLADYRERKAAEKAAPAK